MDSRPSDLAPYFEKALSIELAANRDVSGMRIDEVCAAAGIARGPGYRIFNGKRQPEAVELVHLCEILELDLIEVLTAARERAIRLRKAAVERAEETERRLRQAF